MKKIALGLGAFAMAAALASPGLAHHSTNLWYDMTKTETVQGNFVAMRWINPHTVVQVVANGEMWTMETHGTAVLARAGWRPNQFKTGEKLTIVGNPSRKGLKTLSLLEIKTEDGKDYKVNPSN
jgi:hypothetical protein